MPLAGPSQVAQILVAALALLAWVLLHRRSRSAGLVFLWSSWLFVPLVRRMLELPLGATERDVLSLVPFVITGLAGLAAMRDGRPTRPMLAILGVAAAGFLIGVPAGLAQPMPLAFALLAYGAPMAAAFIGAAEARPEPPTSAAAAPEEVGSQPPAGAAAAPDGAVPEPGAARLGPLGTLGWTLVATLPIVGLYGIVQYYALPLLPWDDAWIRASGLRSLLTPEPGHLRVFSTLNSPYPAAAALGFALLVWFAKPRATLGWAAAGALGTAALALTYSRSAWVGLGVAGLVLLVAARSGVLLRRAVAIGAAIGVVIVAGLWHPTVQAVVARALSLSDIQRDRSAQDRFELIREVVPRGLESLFGHGLGQAGLASSLGGSSPLASPDNGYLAMLYQTGPFGLGLLVIAFAALLVLGVRAARHRDGGVALELSVIVFILVLEFFNDALYGMRGAVLWYVAGRILLRAFAHEPQLRLARGGATWLRGSGPDRARTVDRHALDEGAP